MKSKGDLQGGLGYLEVSCRVLRILAESCGAQPPPRNRASRSMYSQVTGSAGDSRWTFREFCFLVGRRSRVSGEGVRGRGLVGIRAPSWGGGFVPRLVLLGRRSTFERSARN